jgi:hypothetical protein
MYMRTLAWIFGLICSLLLPVARSAAQSFNYVSIDVPCSAFPSGAACPASGYAVATIANGINPGGDIVGSYTDGNSMSHGFLLRDGQFSTIDVDFPWAAVTIGVYGISPGGDIVGRYRAKPNTTADPNSAQYCDGTPACIKGFLYHLGKFSTVLYPGHPGAFAQRITPDGDIYGCLHDHNTGNSMFGAAWLPSGEVSLIAGEGELADPTFGLSMSMNNGATPDGSIIVGHYADMATPSHTHGFVVLNDVLQQPPAGAACYDISGTPCYDIPLSIFTQIWDINPGQQFVGTYKDSSGHQHGFLQLPDGSSPIQLDYPGAAATIAFGINPDGVIVGQYSASGNVHGFAAVPASE